MQLCNSKNKNGFGAYFGKIKPKKSLEIWDTTAKVCLQIWNSSLIIMNDSIQISSVYAESKMQIMKSNVDCSIQ